MGREARITKEIQLYDPALYCARDGVGKLCVYRKSTRWEMYELEDDMVLRVSRPAPWFIFALTDNWRKDGIPADWGIEPILARLQAMDLWKRDLASECLRETEKAEEANKRDAKNSIESFLYEFRSQFKKTFKDTLVHSLEKRDSRRDYEKRVKQ